MHKAQNGKARSFRVRPPHVHVFTWPILVLDGQEQTLGKASGTLLKIDFQRSWQPRKGGISSIGPSLASVLPGRVAPATVALRVLGTVPGER
jgi:hypothetical protein